MTHQRDPLSDTGRIPFQDLRPLDQLQSFKIKLGVLVSASVVAAALAVWIGMHVGLSPKFTIPLAVIMSLLITQVLARGMTSPLRAMTVAAQSMARGDYTRRVHTRSKDEVGQLAEAFNHMAQDLESMDANRRELVANVSHELRTPVAALHAQLENIVDGVTKPDPASLSIALAQTERLGHLVSQLLDLSRLEAGAVPLNREDLQLTPFLHEAADAAKLVAENSGRDVRWVVDVSPADLSLQADPARLHQVIANLMDNASRHTPSGTVVITRAFGGSLHGKPAVVIDVVDQGPGISAEDRERVFERFHRGGTSGTGGTGLGLAIARWAVTLHDGTIEVVDDTKENRNGYEGNAGTAIRVILPLQ